MPEVIDLAQFPRLDCRCCGLVTLVDPVLPVNARAELTCPHCLQPLFAGRGVLGSNRTTPRRRFDGAPAGSPRLATTRGSADGTRVPSNAAVGLALAGIVMLLLVAGFVLLAITPHHAYWEYLTR